MQAIARTFTVATLAFVALGVTASSAEASIVLVDADFDSTLAADDFRETSRSNTLDYDTSGGKMTLTRAAASVDGDVESAFVQFDSINLDNVGDFLQAEFDWIPRSGSSAFRNYALFSNSGGEVPAGDVPPSPATYNSVFALQGTNEFSVEELANGWTDAFRGNSNSSATFSEDDNLRLQVRVERTGASEVTFTLADVTGGSTNVSAQFVDTSSLHTTFDTFMLNSKLTVDGFGPLTSEFDTVDVTTNVPEPASLAMGLVGFGALALRRKRSA